MSDIFVPVEMEKDLQYVEYEKQYKVVVPKLYRLILVSSWLKEVNDKKFIYDKAPIEFLNRVANAISSMSNAQIVLFDKHMFYMLNECPTKAFKTENSTMQDVMKLRQKGYKIKHTINKRKQPKLQKCSKDVNLKAPSTVTFQAEPEIIQVSEPVQEQAVATGPNDILETFEASVDQISEDSQIMDLRASSFLYDVKSKDFINTDYSKECFIVHKSIDSFEVLRHDLKCLLDSTFPGVVWCYFQINQVLQNNITIEETFTNLMYTLQAENNVGFMLIEGPLISMIYCKHECTAKYKRALKRSFHNVLTHFHCVISDYSHIILSMLQTDQAHYSVSDSINVEKLKQKIKKNNELNMYIYYKAENQCYCSIFSEIFENSDSSSF